MNYEITQHIYQMLIILQRGYPAVDFCDVAVTLPKG